VERAKGLHLKNPSGGVFRCYLFVFFDDGAWEGKAFLSPSLLCLALFRLPFMVLRSLSSYYPSQFFPIILPSFFISWFRSSES
jgi:hypothetical protein